jgi:hypothetical protein
VKISIIGDSFSADNGVDSWVTMLSQDHDITNFSCRGISQYRIFKGIQDNLSIILDSDLIVLFHTNPDRVFVPDHVDYPTRSLSSHSSADMMANDIMSRPEWHNISKTYYKYFFDSEFQNTVYAFIIKDIIDFFSQKSVLHCSGHNLQKLPFVDVQSFNDQYLSNPGPTNHLDRAGNKIIFNYITEIIKCQAL